jgi:hypothetical protein
VWMREVDLHSNVECAVKMIVANKVDLVRAPALALISASSCRCVRCFVCISLERGEHQAACGLRE